MSLKIKESELKDILAEVAEDLAKAFKDTEAKLVKSEPIAKEESPGEEGGSEESESPAPGASASGGDAPPPAEGSESAAPPAGPDASAAPSPDGAPAPEGMDPAADQAAALTPEALQAEYSKLAPEELDMHIKAALAAKAAVAGAAPDASAPMAPPADASAPPAAPPAPPAGSPSPLAQAELSPSPERKGERSIDRLGKSEAVADAVQAAADAQSKASQEKIESLEKLVKSQAEDIENLAKIAKSILEQPVRKAVTSVAHLPKVEEKRDLSNLTKADITAHLSKKAASPSLAKSDRQLINDFFDGKVRADKLAPLFEDYK